ncbi:MAG: peptidase MA family metallohydrolase [Candidatus Marinimicrobia bacterium]|nr:peptidase MA family metallohydrolase [Candidatus Neomarinimicrobiota bacterium]
MNRKTHIFRKNASRNTPAQARIIFIALILTLFNTVNANPLQLKTDNLTLISDKGDSTLLRQAIQLIQEEQRIYPLKFGLRLEKELDVYFYYDIDAIGSRIHTVPYWSGGIARAGSEIHIYGRNRSQWLSTLKHELFHTLLGQNEISIPVWLNEGLAQWQAGQMDWGGFMELGNATARGKLIPLVDLDVILSFNHKRASLAYGQSLDATRFLIKRHGESILPYLLQVDGIGFRRRFELETGEDLIDFEIAWRKNLESRFWFFKISTIPTVLWALSPLIIVLAWFLKRQRGKKKLQEWEAEDHFHDDPKYFA